MSRHGVAAIQPGLARRQPPVAGSAPTPSQAAPPSEVATAPVAVLPLSGGKRAALSALLTSGTVPSDRSSALASLLVRWHVIPVRQGLEPCDAALRGGLECLQTGGSWLALRRFDLPAALKLVTPDGRARWATVIALDREEAVLEFGTLVFTVPLREIDTLWDGTFELLWRPPPFRARTLTVGMRGPAVAWLSRTMDEIEGREISARDVYDDTLRTRLMAFQISRSLLSDGIAGVETLARLTATLDRRAPSLSRATAGS
jgi:general secretion pathway protein A